MVATCAVAFTALALCFTLGQAKDAVDQMPAFDVEV